ASLGGGSRATSVRTSGASLWRVLQLSLIDVAYRLGANVLICHELLQGLERHHRQEQERGDIHRLHHRHPEDQDWCEQYPQIRITKLYVYAESDEGCNLIKHLFFAPRYDIGQRAFEVDPLQMNPSKLITAYQDCLKE